MILSRHIPELTHIKANAERVTQPNGQRFIVVVIDPPNFLPTEASFDSSGLSLTDCAEVFDQLAAAARGAHALNPDA